MHCVYNGERNDTVNYQQASYNRIKISQCCGTLNYMRPKKIKTHGCLHCFEVVSTDILDGSNPLTYEPMVNFSAKFYYLAADEIAAFC